MRLIDADALLKDIEKYHVSEGKFQHWVEIQPTIETEPHWIPCPFPYKDENMPKDGEYVLCTTETKKGMRQVIRGYAGQDANGIWHWYCGMNSNVLAWQPLPTPWEGE